MWNRTTALVASMLAALAACAGPEETAPPPSPEPEAAVASYFPMGDPATSLIRVEREMPREIWAGHPFTETVKVTNLTSRELHHVTVRETVGAAFQPGDDLGGGEFKDGAVTWTIDRLGPEETRTLQMTGTVPSEGDFRSCLEADLRPQACETRRVAVAKLEAEAAGPAETLVCEPLAYTVTLRNGGTATMPDVRIESDLPEGLRTDDDASTLRLRAGDLAPGETKEIPLRLKAARTGDFAPMFMARCGPVTAEAPASPTAVREPLLTL